MRKIKILHGMLGKGLGGLEKVFLDYQSILEKYAHAHHGNCVGVVRRNSAVAKQAEKAGSGFETLSVYSEWDPLTLYRVRKCVKTTQADLVIGHGQRFARLFSKATPSTTTMAVCIHKPIFDVELTRTHYLCVGHHLFDLALQRGVPRERVHLIPNAVKTPSVVAQPFTRSGQTPRIVAAGRLHPKKGFDILIQALALLRDQNVPFVCDIAGEGEERQKLEGLIAQLNLHDHVKFIGWQQDVPKFLASGDIYAFPSYQEGFPLVLLEAMAATLPVVASAIPGVVDMIQEGETGHLVPAGKIDILADALAKMLQAPEHAITLGKQARALVLSEYSHERMAERLYAVLDQIYADMS